MGVGREESYGGAGQTVLMVAIQNKDAKMVQLLLEHGADVNAAECVLDKGQELGSTDIAALATPLSVAVHMAMGGEAAAGTVAERWIEK